MSKVRRPGELLLCVGLVATAVVYWPGLYGPFLFDDKPNLLLNPFMYLHTLEPGALKDAALANESGLFRRPIPSLSFALNYYFAGGFDAFSFKLTNLVIHLINGVLVFALVKRLTGQFIRTVPVDKANLTLIPAVVSLWWLLHPLQLTSVLYVVQRMTSMSAFFVLAGLVIFMIGRARFESDHTRGLVMMYAGILGGGTIGVLCKENAALIPLYALVIEICCFSRMELNTRSWLQLRLFYWVVLVVPTLLVIAYVAVHPEFILSGYQVRSFSLTERLLSQPRVLVFYLGLIFFPSREDLGLFHDDFPVSVGLFSPLTTFFAITTWAALIIIAVATRRKLPLLLFAISWYVAGHVMESTVLSLEMVFEHRNYLPSIGPIVFLVYAIAIGLRKLGENGRAAFVALGLVTLTFGFVTHSRAYSWSDTYVLLESMVKHHPNAARTHGFYAEALINSRANPEKAFYHLQQYSRLSSESINGLAEMLRLVKSAQLAGESHGTSKEDGVRIFDSPLRNDASSLARMEHLLVDEIERRIRDYPITSSTVKTIRDLQGCIYAGATICVDLAPRLARWAELALANSKITSRHRAILLSTSAKIQTWLGNIEKGKRYALRAAKTAPEEVHFSIELAELHLALGEYARALEIVERIQRERARFGFRMGEVEALEARLRSAMSEENSENHTSVERQGEIRDRL